MNNNNLYKSHYKMHLKHSKYYDEGQCYQHTPPCTGRYLHPRFGEFCKKHFINQNTINIEDQQQWNKFKYCDGTFFYTFWVHNRLYQAYQPRGKSYGFQDAFHYHYMLRNGDSGEECNHAKTLFLEYANYVCFFGSGVIRYFFIHIYCVLFYVTII